MRYLILLILAYIIYPKDVYSCQIDKDTDCNESELECIRKGICYKFGMSSMITIYVADGDSICEVSIIDGRGKHISTICNKNHLLKWAFDDMADAVKSLRKVADEDYKPFHYELSILNDTSQIILSSAERLTDDSEDVRTKLEELKAFLVELWYSNSGDMTN